MKGYEYKSDFAKKYVAQGRAEGEARGEARGEAKGEAKGLLVTLQARGFAVPDAVRERILAQTDQECLELWLQKAVVAASLADVLGEPS